MEVDLGEIDSEEVQSEMLASAMLPDGKTLHDDHGAEPLLRVPRAWLTRSESSLSTFDQFAPWFVAEAISQVQLAQLGFDPQSGVEMYFTERARTDGKSRCGSRDVA